MAGRDLTITGQRSALPIPAGSHWVTARPSVLPAVYRVVAEPGAEDVSVRVEVWQGERWSAQWLLARRRFDEGMVRPARAGDLLRAGVIERRRGIPFSALPLVLSLLSERVSPLRPASVEGGALSAEFTGAGLLHVAVEVRP